MSKWGVYNMLPPIFEKITFILCFFKIGCRETSDFFVYQQPKTFSLKIK